MSKTELEFPEKNQRFFIDDFFQTDVDAFHTGYFRFLSAKEVYIKTDKFVKDKTLYVHNKGWIISTYCYTEKCYYKILVCRYQQMPWENHYHIEGQLAHINGCYGYSINETIENVIDWIQYTR